MPRQIVLNGAVKRWAKNIAQDLDPDFVADHFPLSTADIKELVRQSFDRMGDVFYGGAYGWDDCAEILADLARQEAEVNFNWQASGGTAGEYIMMGAHDAVAAYIISIADHFARMVEDVYHDLNPEEDYEEEEYEEYPGR